MPSKLFRCDDGVSRGSGQGCGAASFRSEAGDVKALAVGAAVGPLIAFHLWRYVSKGVFMQQEEKKSSINRCPYLARSTGPAS